MHVFLQFGQTTIMKAAQWGKIETTKVLLDNGADLRDRDMFQMTPFLHACYNGQLDMVKYLLTQGANVLDTDHVRACSYPIVAIDAALARA